MFWLRRGFPPNLLKHQNTFWKGFLNCSTTQKDGNRLPSTLLHQLIARIQLKGPMTVAEYMKEVLTNSAMGYYMKGDVFGVDGDFITSPEITQMFGELIGIWCIHSWMEAGEPEKVQIVELGPGRGTLVYDMLKTFTQFGKFAARTSVHLVEISPELQSIQRKKLQPYNNIPISWYTSIKDVPSNFSLYVGHEFLDALPIHKFQLKDNKWCEILIDCNESRDSLNFVLSPQKTIATSLYLPPVLSLDVGDKDHIEVCPEAAVIVQHIALQISTNGGLALFADYGHNGERGDTFRAFKNHSLHKVLEEPGSADLTSDVDFSYLKHAVKDTVKVHGPVTQCEFLHRLGIYERLTALGENCDDKARKNLVASYDLLVNPIKMGERFKFLCLSNKDYQFRPAGFEDNIQTSAK